jgi:integrase
MTPLRQAADDYLAIRRSLGFKLRRHDHLLADFLDHLEASGAESITVVAAVRWATSRPNASPEWCSQRLSVVRSFARHVQCLDPATEVPPKDLLGRRRSRPTPYLYSSDEIAGLLRAAAALWPALLAASYETYFGLLAATGMRMGEARRLDRADVDLGAGVVQINEAKFHKQRRLPLHPSTTDALRRYAGLRDRLCPSPRTPAFSSRAPAPVWAPRDGRAMERATGTWQPTLTRR